MAIGLAGTTAMAFAGAGLTRVPGTSQPLPWFFSLPVGWSTQHHLLLEGCYYAGLAALGAAWLVLGRSLRPGHRPDIHALWLAAAVWAVPLVVGPVLNTSDIYAYLNQAAVARAGLDPYRFGPAVLGHSRLLASMFPAWRTTPSPYGPLFVVLASAVGAVAGPHVAVGVMGLRLVAIVALVVVGRQVPRLASSLGADPVRATWLAVASPIVLVEFVMSGHNDIVMIALLVVALTLREEGRPVAAIALCALAVMVKAPALLALGFVALAWVAAAGGRRAQLRRACQAGLVAAGVMASTSLAAGLGWGWLRPGVLTTSTRLLTLSTPTDVVGLLSGGALGAVGLHVSRSQVLDGAHLAGLLLAGAFFIGVLRRASLLGWTRSIGLCLFAVPILAPITWSWYLAWGLVILAATGPGQCSRALVAVAAGVEFAFGPPIGTGVLIGVATAVVACVALPYWLGWSYRNLVRPWPPGGPVESSLLISGAASLASPPLGGEA